MSDWSRLIAKYTISEASTFERWSQISDQMYLPQLEGTEVLLQQTVLWIRSNFRWTI